MDFPVIHYEIRPAFGDAVNEDQRHNQGFKRTIGKLEDALQKIVKGDRRDGNCVEACEECWLGRVVELQISILERTTNVKYCELGVRRNGGGLMKRRSRGGRGLHKTGHWFEEIN